VFRSAALEERADWPVFPLPLSSTQLGKEITLTAAIKAPPPKAKQLNGTPLDGVGTRGKALPDRIVLYASQGWGKTSFAAHMPGVIFGTTRGEDGLQTLIENGQLAPTPHFQEPLTTWNEVCLAVSKLTVMDHDYKTFVLDLANGAERLAHEQICETECENEWGEKGFNAFGRGEKVSTNKLWIPFLQRLDSLREAKQMRIVLLCHAITRNFPNPNGPNYDRIEPALSKTSWTVTKGWADMILYGAFETFVEAKKTEKQAAFSKGKATGGHSRILHTQPHAIYDAKNRHGLPAEIVLGESATEAWANFVNTFPKKGQPQ
jgi:hypothetical protein